MLERRVEVRLESQLCNLIKMVAVYVRIDAEQPFQHHFEYGQGLHGKGDTWLRGEYGFVVEVAVAPGNEAVNVVAGGHGGGALVLGVLGVLPQVLVVVRRHHARAAAGSAPITTVGHAKVRNGAI